MKKKSIALIGAALLSTVLLAACGSKSSQPKDTNVKLGVIGSDADVWKPVAQRLKKQHINLQLVQFTDYNKPNQAVLDSDLDINAFQHYDFLHNWEKAHKDNKLTAIGNTYIGPLRVYSNKVKNIKDLKKGDTVALPNDPTNEGRALILLETAGLIKLDDSKSQPTTRDIKDNKKDLKFSPVDASQTARSLTSATASVVNNDMALNAKLKPSEAIYVEKINDKSKPWVNIIVTKKSEKNNKVYKKIVKAYQTAATKKEIKKVYDGSTIAAWDHKF
ncbi:MetQ/NlpA family ABC transporter substrate-binding protein [Lacticaseibacillus pabuli]|uniref:Lipoprotein n=1 Tax=Lacticaseibacillus pabuli TaxID=3025672 RepID=A0ABY7WNF9_9LACO|nr:MetQ/NlpA family ABC transporter substrate-binding protein [Lacticaseibacillus sp. KACC 23028]WDF81752.1 MetQ/NlpA family ABC transporter substrate-binding protein [Lacticaseibacillus sp. KACC 23028]